MYHALRDFAGPIATIIAAVVAAGVAWQFGRGQRQIAQQQAVTAQGQENTARQRLKLDLYEKRFNIYITVLDLYLADMKKELSDIKEAEFPFVKAFRESQFLFLGQDGVYDTLNKIKDAHGAISVHEEQKEKDKKNSFIADRASVARNELEKLLLTLEAQLDKYLDFRKIL